MNVGDIYKVFSLKSNFNIISSVPTLYAPNGWKSLLKWIRANLIFENYKTARFSFNVILPKTKSVFNGKSLKTTKYRIKAIFFCVEYRSPEIHIIKWVECSRSRSSRCCGAVYSIRFVCCVFLVFLVHLALQWFCTYFRIPLYDSIYAMRSSWRCTEVPDWMK